MSNFLKNTAVIKETLNKWTTYYVLFIRFRCTEKILNQLEHHTEKILAQQNKNGYQNRKYTASIDDSDENNISYHLSNGTSEATLQSDDKSSSYRKVSFFISYVNKYF